LVFLDESGYLLQPLRRRVWAPVGETPLQHAWDRHDRITALAALTRAPWAERFGLYYSLLDHNARTPDVVRFLRDVHGHIRRSLLLVCDRWSVHRAAVRRLQHDGAKWLSVEWLPAYAPELDPVESVWNQTKYGDLANFIPDDILEMHDVLDALLQQYRHDPDRLHSFFRSAHLIP
jgi:transposase